MKKLLCLSVSFLLAACSANVDKALGKSITENANEQIAKVQSQVIPTVRNIDIDVLYKVNQVQPSKNVIAYLSEMVVEVAKTSYKSIQIVGYTDNTGSAKGNLFLSHQRATKLAQVIKGFGIDENKITAYGLGSVNPKLDCTGLLGDKLKQCHNQNRRVEITVIY